MAFVVECQSYAKNIRIISVLRKWLKSMAIDSATQDKIRRRPLERLVPHATAADTSTEHFDFTTPIDLSRWFVCPTLTPLYYAPIYSQFEERHQRRYNQLTALSFSELIGYFETTFAASVLAAITKSRIRAADQPLVNCLETFVAEEERHSDWWLRLNRLSAPELYAETNRAIIRISFIARHLLRQLTSHSFAFPFVYWVMLALEERSLDISRRCMRMPTSQIEPRYLAIYRAHLSHEVRHVQIDWHLIERFYATRSAAVRRLNASMFRVAMRRFFLPPVYSAARVISQLVTEHPELKSRGPLMLQQLHHVGHHPAYQEMMYSRESTPITFALFDHFPEFHSMSRVLLSYQAPHLL